MFFQVFLIVNILMLKEGKKKEKNFKDFPSFNSHKKKKNLGREEGGSGL